MNKSRAQNIILSSGKFNTEREYWLNKLSGNISGVSFPYDFCRSISEEVKRAKKPFTISEDVAATLHYLSNNSNKRLFMVLQTVMKILLFRYTSEKDLLVVSPIDNQEDAGEYLNTILILRDWISGELSFKDLLMEIRSTVLDARTNQNYPYNIILQDLNLVKEELLKVGIVFENFQDSNVLEEINLDLIFGFKEENGIIRGYIDYNVGLYQDETIEQIINHFLRLLKNATQNKDMRISELELLSDAERTQLVVGFNQTEKDYPQQKTIHQLFEEQVERTPENYAIVFENNKLSYRELNEKANQFANLLVKMGVGPEDLVGIMFEPSIEILIGILAVLKAGGAYLPIDALYPADRVKFMLEDSKVEILLTMSNLENRVPDKFVNTAGKVLNLDCADLYLREDSKNLERSISSKNLAYVIYTSGSTGQPKGVLVEHRSVVNLSHWQILSADISSEDRISKYVSFSFDASVVEIFSCILAGASLVMVPDEVKYESEKLGQWFMDNNITITYLPTNISEILAQNLPNLNLRYLITGGDRLKRFFDTDYTIVNNYGPTENTVTSTAYLLQRACEETEYNIPPIGKPITNTQVYILDEYLNPVPQNVVGEIYLAGAGLSRGYLNRPEMNAERFLQNPFIAGTRMYKTGDLGRWLKDGNIEFVGRSDNQVMIRGFRIEIGEIETSLFKHAAIKAAVVVPMKDDEGNMTLISYLVADQQLKISELREYLLKSLPEYMIPAQFCFIAEIPLTQNGKVDLKALPKIEDDILSDREYIAPRNEIERTLAKIWAEILKLKRVGIYDNFFELGGHSIKATKVIARIYKELGVQLSVRHFFQTPTIAEIAEKIKRAEHSVYKEIESQTKREYYPLSHAQNRLWILDQLSEGMLAYNMPAAFILKGKLILDAFRQAFLTVVDRHEILRTRFSQIGGDPVQIVEDHFDFNLEYSDASESDFNGDIKEYVQNQLKIPFDLTKPGLIRASLVKINQDEHILISNMHHIISDGLSTNILISELAVLYNAFTKKELNPLHPLKIQYRDYAIWQNKALENGSLKGQEEYWLEKLQGDLSLLHLLYDEVNTDNHNLNGGSEEIEISDEMLKKLRQIALNADATLYMMIIAALKILIYKLTNKTDIIIGTSIAGRNHEQLENLIGFFVNTLVLRTDLAGDPDFTELLNRVKETTIGAYENQDYPYDGLVEKVLHQDGQADATNELFTIMINYLPESEDETVELNGLQVINLDHAVEEAKFDLSFYVLEMEESLTIRVTYNTTLFTPISVQKMLKYFQNILNTICEEPKIQLSNISLFTAEDYSSFLDDFNEEL